MTQDIEKKFLTIANKTSSEAASVDCSILDYKEGLEIIIEDLDTARSAAQDDLDREEG